MHMPCHRAICAWLVLFAVVVCAQGAVGAHAAAHKPGTGAPAVVRVGGNSSTWTGQWLLVDDVLHGSTAVANALQQRARLAAHPTQDGSPEAGPVQQQQPSPRQVAMFVLVACTLILAAGGGMGGGAIFVPLFIVVGGEHSLAPPPASAQHISPLPHLPCRVLNHPGSGPVQHHSAGRRCRQPLL
jgi:hypothetical protein